MAGAENNNTILAGFDSNMNFKAYMLTLKNRLDLGSNITSFMDDITTYNIKAYKQAGAENNNTIQTLFFKLINSPDIGKNIIGKEFVLYSKDISTFDTNSHDANNLVPICLIKYTLSAYTNTSSYATGDIYIIQCSSSIKLFLYNSPRFMKYYDYIASENNAQKFNDKNKTIS